MPIDKEILQRLEKNDSTLIELCLNLKNLTDADIVPLAKALAKNATLTALDLSQNNIREAGMKALSKALTKNATLTKLNLCENLVSDAGAKALSEALAKNSTLTKLNLYHNLVGDAGATTLSKGLAKNSTLKTLELGENQVGDAGAKALSEGLAKNAILTTLGLSFNYVGNAGVKALSEALVKNSTLTELNLFSTLTKLNLFANQVDDTGQAYLQAIEQKLAQNKALAFSGSSDVKDSVPPSFNSDVKANPLPSSLPSLPPTSPIDKTTSVLDAKTLDKLFKLAAQQEAQLLQPAAPQASQESMEALQKKLSSIEGTMQHLDGEALAVLQGKAQEVHTLIDQATAHRQAEAERNHIESDDCLCDYYYVVRSQLLHMWLACQVIHSEMVDNDKKTKLDYLADNIDKIAGRFPGLSLLIGFIKGAASGWSYREKKEAMQHMAAFCLGLVEGDTVIDTLARQLTLSQAVILKAKLAPGKTGTFRKALAAFKKAKNWALVNDIDNATQEFAAKQASQILEVVMKGKIKTPCRSKDIPQLFSLVMGVNAVYQSPIALPATTNSSNPAAAINAANVNSSSAQPTQSYSRMQVTLNAAPNATAKDEVAELKRVVEEQQRWKAEQEEKMKVMQEELSRVKNQHQTKEPTAQKRDLDSLQAEFSRLKAESQQNGSQVQKQEFDNLQRELKKLQEGLEQAGITRGGNQLQMSSTAFGAGTVTSEQRQIAELQQQVRLLTARVLTTQEPQSPQDEAEDPARLKLIL